MLGNGETHGARQLIGIALDEVLEGLLQVELRIQALRHSGIQHVRRLIAAGGGCRCLNLSGRIALHLGDHLLVIIRHNRHNAIAKNHVGAEHPREYLT